MTLEQIIDCDAAKLEAMTDAELLEHFKPYLDVTRPELARAAQASRPQSSGVGKHYATQGVLPIYTEKQLKVLKELAAQGIDTSFMEQRFKQKRNQ